MKRIPINEAPAGMWLDLAAAEAANYIRVPFKTAKKTPPELSGMDTTVERYVFFFVDSWARYSMEEGVWRRRHGAGDFWLWQPSSSFEAAMDLIEDRKRCDFDEAYAISMNYIFSDAFGICVGEWQVEFAGSTHSDEFDSAIGEAGKLPLAITRAYLIARGIESVEVSGEEDTS